MLDWITKSKIFRRFVPIDLDDPSDAVNAAGVVCALILTIPFGLAQLFSADSMSELKTILDSCPKGSWQESNGYTYSYIQYQISANTTACIYSSMAGVVLSSTFHLYKPNADDMAAWVRKHGMAFLFMLIIATIISIGSLLNVSSDVLNYALVAADDICDYNVNGYYLPGVLMLVAVFFASIIVLTDRSAVQNASALPTTASSASESTSGNGVALRAAPREISVEDQEIYRQRNPAFVHPVGTN